MTITPELKWKGLWNVPTKGNYLKFKNVCNNFKSCKHATIWVVAYVMDKGLYNFALVSYEVLPCIAQQRWRSCLSSLWWSSAPSLLHMQKPNLSEVFLHTHINNTTCLDFKTENRRNCVWLESCELEKYNPRMLADMFSKNEESAVQFLTVGRANKCQTIISVLKI